VRLAIFVVPPPRGLLFGDLRQTGPFILLRFSISFHTRGAEWVGGIAGTNWLPPPPPFSFAVGGLNPPLLFPVSLAGDLIAASRFDLLLRRVLSLSLFPARWELPPLHCRPYGPRETPCGTGIWPAGPCVSFFQFFSPLPAAPFFPFGRLFCSRADVLFLYWLRGLPWCRSFLFGRSNDNGDLLMPFLLSRNSQAPNE